MALSLNHVHLKTPDPETTASFYVEALGAIPLGPVGQGGYRLDLHGLHLNVTTLAPHQRRAQVYGIEHVALDTDDLDGTVAQLRAHGARVVEETTSATGRRLCFLEGPDRVQLELIEVERPRRHGRGAPRG